MDADLRQKNFGVQERGPKPRLGRGSPAFWLSSWHMEKVLIGAKKKKVYTKIARSRNDGSRRQSLNQFRPQSCLDVQQDSKKRG